MGLALALVVQEERAHSDEAKSAEQLLFLVSGIAMLTLLINGWSCKTLLDYLGMTVEASDTRHVRAYAKSAAAHAAAIALHDIVAKYGLGRARRRASREKSTAKASDAALEPRPSGHETGRRARSTWLMIPVSTAATWKRTTSTRLIEKLSRSQRTGVAAHAGHVLKGPQSRVLGDDREGSSAARVVSRPKYYRFLVTWSCRTCTRNCTTSRSCCGRARVDPVYSQIEKCVELFVSWLKGLKQRGCLGDRIIFFVALVDGDGTILFITAFHAAYMRTSKHPGRSVRVLCPVFSLCSRTRADQFKEEIDAQIKQCEDEAAKLPAHARARVDALLAAEVS